MIYSVLKRQALGTSLLSPGQYSSDDMDFDPGLSRLYVAGVPFINVFQNNDLIGQVPSSFHGITAILVPELNRVRLFWNDSQLYVKSNS